MLPISTADQPEEPPQAHAHVWRALALLGIRMTRFGVNLDVLHPANAHIDERWTGDRFGANNKPRWRGDVYVDGEAKPVFRGVPHCLLALAVLAVAIAECATHGRSANGKALMAFFLIAALLAASASALYHRCSAQSEPVHLHRAMRKRSLLFMFAAASITPQAMWCLQTRFFAGGLVLLTCEVLLCTTGVVLLLLVSCARTSRFQLMGAFAALLLASAHMMVEALPAPQAVVQCCNVALVGASLYVYHARALDTWPDIWGWQETLHTMTALSVALSYFVVRFVSDAIL